MRANTVLRCAA